MFRTRPLGCVQAATHWRPPLRAGGAIISSVECCRSNWRRVSICQAPAAAWCWEAEEACSGQLRRGDSSRARWRPPSHAGGAPASGQLPSDAWRSSMAQIPWQLQPPSPTLGFRAPSAQAWCARRLPGPCHAAAACGQILPQSWQRGSTALASKTPLVAACS